MQVIKLMGKVKKNVDAVKRYLFFLRKPVFRTLVLDMKPIYLVFTAIVLFLVIYFVSIFSNASSVDQVAIRNSIAIDADQLAGIWATKEYGFAGKLLSTTNFVYQLVTIAPILLLISSLILYPVRRYLIKSGSMRAKIKIIQDQLKNAAKVVGLRQINFNFIDFSGATFSNISGQVFAGMFGDTVAVLNQSNDSVRMELGSTIVEVGKAINASEYLSPEEKGKVLEVVNKLGGEAAKSRPNSIVVSQLREGLVKELDSVADVESELAVLLVQLDKLLDNES